MRKVAISLIGLLCLCYSVNTEESLIEVHLRIEDGDYGESIKSFRFDEESIILNAPEYHFPRRSARFHQNIGRHVVEWSVSYPSSKEEGKGQVDHKRSFFIRGDDPLIRVIIRGHEIWIR